MDRRQTFALGDTPAPLSVVKEVYTAAAQAFERYKADGRYPYQRSFAREPGGVWTDFSAAIGLLDGALATIVDDAPLDRSGMGAGFYEIPKLDAVVLVDCDPDWTGWHVQAAAATADAATEAAALIETLLPPATDWTVDERVRFSVWMHHPMAGAVSRAKMLDGLPWADVQDNYPPSVQPELSTLLEMTGAPAGGRLMVFHGPPGTGKTKFLETLATEWRDWCDVHYVLDPDEMFSHATYLNSLVLDAERSDRWMLLVLEDGDEFIDVGAKGKVGQGLSRLLNLADGFIGQATKMLVLISTNVEHESFQPAAVRAGRCFAKIEFPAFTSDEAGAWAMAHGLEGSYTEDVTLAELYGSLW